MSIKNISKCIIFKIYLKYLLLNVKENVVFLLCYGNYK